MLAPLVLLMSQVSHPAPPDLAELNRRAGRFARTEMRVDLSALPPSEKQALGKLIEAARVLDGLFLDQMWSGNRALLAKLKKDASPLGKARLHEFWLNKSPWSGLDGEEAFLPGVPPRKLPGANYYPEKMTKSEFEAWTGTLPEGKRKEAEGFFSVIRRDAAGKLIAVPFHEAYREDLTRAARLLKEAAAATSNASLEKFLASRAEAFFTDDYFESDVAWMDLDSAVDVTIGPYETYHDELFGYKADFEAYVSLRDESETKRLGFFARHLQEIEDHLPLEPSRRNPKIGALAPICVVNEVFAAGGGNQGVQTAAYNLPNDEKIVAQKGTKRIMLKNVQEAKFEKTLRPIAERVLKSGSLADLSFDAFFTHVLAHELTHGLGPHAVEAGGRKTTPRQELKELYSAIEEAKADVTGLFALQYLMDHPSPDDPPNALPRGPEAERRLYTTFLASAFRTLRFGSGDAHAKGMLVQLNTLLDGGGFVADPDGTFAVDFTKIKGAVESLDKELLTVEATGDYAAAGKLLAERGVVRPAVVKALERLKDVPTDIEPLFPTAEGLVPVRP